MENKTELWDALRKQKTILEEQEERVYRLLEELTALVLAGQITSFDEVEDILFELMEMDYYIPAMELWRKLFAYIRQHFPEYGNRHSVGSCPAENTTKNKEEL